MQPTTAPLRIGHGARPLASESHWLLSTAGKWTEEDEKEWKRQQHRENMVFFRRKKKEQQAELRTQHQQLEQRLQQHLAMQRRAASRASQNHRYGTSRDKKHAAVCHLIAETEALKIENVALRDQINKHKTLQDGVLEAGDGLEYDATEPTSSVASRDGSSSTHRRPGDRSLLGRPLPRPPRRCLTWSRCSAAGACTFQGRAVLPLPSLRQGATGLHPRGLRRQVRGPTASY